MKFLSHEISFRDLMILYFSYRSNLPLTITLLFSTYIFDRLYIPCLSWFLFDCWLFISPISYNYACHVLIIRLLRTWSSLSNLIPLSFSLLWSHSFISVVCSWSVIFDFCWLIVIFDLAHFPHWFFDFSGLLWSNSVHIFCAFLFSFFLCFLHVYSLIVMYFVWVISSFSCVYSWFSFHFFLVLDIW